MSRESPNPAEISRASSLVINPTANGDNTTTTASVPSFSLSCTTIKKKKKLNLFEQV